MKRRAQAVRKKTGEKETAYITKRVVVRAASSAVRKASKKAMEVAGYVVKAENGWVVRVDQNGNKSKISRIGTVAPSLRIALD